MSAYQFEQLKYTVNGYKIEDIILWSIGLFLSIVSIIFSILSYYFSNKSTKLITELMEKTWVISETDKFFFDNMKRIKNKNNIALKLLNYDENITYEEYISSSLGTRIIHINKETIDFLRNTKYKQIINTYLNEKKICDEMFFKAVPIDKIISSSKEKITDEELKNLIQYHKAIAIFVSSILKEYTILTL